LAVVPNLDAAELRSVAAIVAMESPPRLIGPCTLVTNGQVTVGFTSSELLRIETSAQLVLATKLDGTAAIPLATWTPGRYATSALVELGAPLPLDHDVLPLPIGNVTATVDTRGAPSALVTIGAGPTGWTRLVIPVQVDAVGRDEVFARLATPNDPMHGAIPIEGAPLFAWFPPDPLLGRPSEVVVVALASTYHRRMFQPRTIPAVAELVGLEDLGRALPYSAPEKEPNLAQVAGEIQDRGPRKEPPMDPLDEIRRQRK
jgi:hypothetical protein